MGWRQRQASRRLRRAARPNYFVSGAYNPATNNKPKPMKAKITLAACFLLAFSASTANSFGPAKKPNILVIMGDDIGWFNPSCYNSGVMGYRTPNIDRIAAEGGRFTDWYGQQAFPIVRCRS